MTGWALEESLKTAELVAVDSGSEMGFVVAVVVAVAAVEAAGELAAAAELGVVVDWLALVVAGLFGPVVAVAAAAAEAVEDVEAAEAGNSRMR